MHIISISHGGAKGTWRIPNERAEHVEVCEDFGRVLGMNMGNWWMGQRGQIEDRVLKKLKKIDEAL